VLLGSFLCSLPGRYVVIKAIFARKPSTDEELSISVVEGRSLNNPAGSEHRSGIHFGMLF